MKRTRLMNVLMIIFTIVFFASCTFFQPSPSVCEKPEAGKSVICDLSAKLGMTPEKVGLIMRLGSAALLDKNPDETKKALEYIDEALSVLNEDGMTYLLFAQFFKDNPSSLINIIAGELLSEMGNLDMLMDAFDIYLIKTHLTKQKRMVEFSLARSK